MLDAYGVQLRLQQGTAVLVKGVWTIWWSLLSHGFTAIWDPACSQALLQTRGVKSRRAVQNPALPQSPMQPRSSHLASWLPPLYTGDSCGLPHKGWDEAAFTKAGHER